MSETEGKASVTCLLAIAEAWAARLEDEDEELRAKVKRQAAELTSVREALEQRNCDIRCYKMKESRYLLENVKLRKVVRQFYRFAFDKYPDAVEREFADSLRELGIMEEVNG